MRDGLGKATGELPDTWGDAGSSGFILHRGQPNKTSRPRIEMVRRRLPRSSERHIRDVATATAIVPCTASLCVSEDVGR